MKRKYPARAPYGIVGDGKASRHLQAYFRLLKTPYIVWRRGSGIPLSEELAQCEKIFVLIADSGIDAFIRTHPFLKSRKLFHFSGCSSTGLAVGLHPFMPLSTRRLTLEQYRSIPFALDPRARSLKALVPEFDNPYFTVKKSGKALYHALCVLGGNLPFLLWSKVLKEMRGRFGIPEKYIRSYFRASLENFEHDPRAGLTGPLQRKDAKTIKANLKALKGDPFRRVYSAFARTV